VAEGDWPQSKGVAILSFESLREAELWKDSVPEIRQPDWLDGVDMIIAPVRSMPRKSLSMYVSYLTHTQGAQAWITQCYLQLHRFLPIPRKGKGKGKGKGLDTCYSATYMSQTRDWQRFTI